MSAVSNPPSLSQASRLTSMPGGPDREHGAVVIVLALVDLTGVRSR